MARKADTHKTTPSKVKKSTAGTSSPAKANPRYKEGPLVSKNIGRS